MRIRTKFSLFVIPLVLLPLVVVGFFSYNVLTGGFKEQAHFADRQLSASVAQRIEQHLDNCHTNLLLLSSIISNRLNMTEEQSIETLVSTDEKFIEEIADAVALRFSPHLRIRIIAPDGRELFIAAGDNWESELRSALDEPIFLQSVSVSGQFPPVKKDPQGSLASTFSRSLTRQETLLGFVYFDLDMDAIVRILRDMAVTKPGYYFLFDGSGTILAEAGTIPLSTQSPAQRKFETSIRYMRENPQPAFTHFTERIGKHNIFLSIQPVKEYITFRDPIPQDRWYLGIAHMDTPLLSAFRQSKMFFWVVLSIGLAIAVFGIAYISREITTPIRRLTNTAWEFSQGRLDSSVEVHRNDEIGRLTVDFNTMAAEIKQLIKERQSNETLIAVGRFSAALAHDLRNPVEGMRLLAGELKKRIGATDPEREIADAIAQSVENLSSFINQSLDFTRLTEPKFAQIDLQILTEEVLQTFRFGDVKLKREYSHDLPLVEVDAVQIKRVINNLIANALDACRQQSSSVDRRINIKIVNLNDKIKIELGDTGIGITPEIRDKIFEPFYTTKPGGHGLGLASARQIIHNHGGTISMHSELNKGTRFIIELPVNPLERKPE
jgi:two-component system, NtrC family, sensor kinase